MVIPRDWFELHVKLGKEVFILGPAKVLSEKRAPSDMHLSVQVAGKGSVRGRGYSSQNIELQMEKSKW